MKAMSDGDEGGNRQAQVLSPSDDGGEVCPYQGLVPFEREKTEFFFGRARATRSLVARLGARRDGHGTVLLVSGASGVGKARRWGAGHGQQTICPTRRK